MRYTHKNKFISSLLLILLMQPALAEEKKEGLEYSIRLSSDNSSYEIYMRPTKTPVADISLSGQVTIKVPHKADDPFQVIDVKNHVETISWIEIARVDAPKEDPSADYISFAFPPPANGPHAFQWKGGEEKLVFSFKNASHCYGDIGIMEATDPFAKMPNSANTAANNQFTNLGWGSVESNVFIGTYGKAAKCKK